MVVVSPPNPESRQIAQYLADLEMRMSRIEAGLRTVQLSNSSIEGAGIAMYDSEGHYRGMIGFHDDGTTAVTSVNPQAPPVPRPPQVTPAMGCLVISHAGDNVNGASNPADFSHLNVYVASAGSPGVRTFVGTINPVPGEFVVSDLDYISYVVTVTAVNMGGTESAQSVGSTGTPTHVDGPDLAANSITATKIAAGAVTATKLEANLILATRIIAGSATGARVEMHPTAGIQAFNSAGVRTFIVEAATGNYFSVGQFATGFTGSRIIMNTGQAEPDTIRLYQSSNTYAIIFADPAPGGTAGVFMRGSNPNSGKVGAYSGEGFTSWVDAGLNLSRSAFDCTSASATAWGGAVVLDARERWGPADIIFRFRDTFENIYTGMDTKFLHLVGDHPCFYNNSLDLGLSWDSAGFIVQGVAPPAYKPILASAFTVSSSRTTKKNEKDIVLNQTSTSRQGISEVRPKQWHYQNEWDGTGPRPPAPTWTSQEVVRDAEGKAMTDDNGDTLTKGTTHKGHEVQAVKPHIGLVAEDLIGVFPELVSDADTIDGGLVLNITDTVGMMWDAMHDEVNGSMFRERRLPKGVSGTGPYGTVIDSFDIPPDPPTTGALMYEFGGSVYVVSYTGKRSKVA